MRLVPVVVVALALCGTAAAQQAASMPMPEYYREAQLKMLEYQRAMLLEMADSMPEALYRDRATPPQRDFAQQIHHAAGAAAVIAQQLLGGPELALPDTGATFNTRAGLIAYINAAYDYSAALMKGHTPEQRATMVPFFGIEIPAWQVWDEIHQHTLWTAGSVVANFRKHGMAPPAFGFF